MSGKLCQPWKTAPPTSVPGVLPSAYSLMLRKPEVLWFGTAANLRKISPDVSSIRVGSTVVMPTTVVRNLGVMLDAELSMHEHVSRTAQSCFYHLRRLRSVRRQLGRDVTARLVSAFVAVRLL